MTAGWRFFETEPGLRRRIEAWWNAGAPDDDSHAVVDRTAHRRALDWPGAGTPLLVKHFRVATHPHARRERAKHALGADAWHRERRGLLRLGARGLPVPALRAAARTPEGDALLACDRVDGPTLWAVLAARPPERRALLARVADAVARLHAAGFVHGDLHPGNVLIGADGPVFVDLQRARRARPGGRAQRRDLGLLDYSLGQLAVPRTDRLRVLRDALGIDEGAPRRLARESLRAAVVAAERTRDRQTRIRARHGRAPAQGTRWRPRPVDGPSA